ncbi:MAG: hypothetical protein BWY04_00391 [candidate division CPR1 bacterium ADurb.Bin160]|jgi:hypothetical protein|uniref:Uncharacterized protein n=1 Tax=candidate division CPR1 bacterium ADurb.Bin160 TaxID=1852826 RepID=A0A1V5ZPF2_9BACT|nr:MAG: hypothetical protein BWY04_00391 [candidate division CPR1 bacterium ADurb.Bin160]
MKLIRYFEINKKDNNMICLESDDLVVLDDEIFDDSKLDEQVLILVIYEILFEIFFDDDLVVLDEVDDPEVEKISKRKLQSLLMNRIYELQKKYLILVKEW